MKQRKMTLFFCLLLSWYSSVPLFSQTLDSAFFAPMRARSIGPAGMSGRIAAVDIVISNPEIMYVGTAMGGVWKSVTGGVSWMPIFDGQNTSSIGAVAIYQANPDLVWVGTGEGNVRNSVGVGRGIFKSLDGGRTWKNMGLEKTERIHRVITHPSNPDIVYVAALGPAWGDGTERGVFKTTDGGKTWKRALYVNERTGACDLVIDPSNPNRLIAGMWEYRRQPWFFTSGGQGSGIYTSNDAGENWNKVSSKEGLPEGQLGRSGLAFSRSNPNVVYALVEAKESALLRSDDGGFQWRTVNKERTVNPRPFYFCDIRVHPKQENTIYRLQVSADISADGGKSFQTWLPTNTVHADHHELWIHPDGNLFVNGNDGGLCISRDGKRFQFVDNLPLGQFYHIAVDNDYPYNVYGGMQDNGSWRGPSTSFKSDGIYNAMWEAVLFGDGFAVLPDPDNNEFGYAMSQGGALAYFNYRTGVRKGLRPTESDVKHRYNWNAAIAIDPLDTKTLYYGSQFVHKTKNKGQSWELISPDLTTNDPEKQKSYLSGGITRDVTAAENHCTILSITPSPVKPGVIWVSTDDGNVQVTQDGGKTWTNVSPANTKTVKVTGTVPPQGAWSPHVEASSFEAGTAFVVFDDHRRSNGATYLYVTRDFGKTWTSLVTPEIDGFCHIIRQDPQAENLLFLGTEFGLFVSVNGGKNWTKWKAGFPTVPVNDMVIHKRDGDLVIATHGRAAYILDDIRPLRALAKANAQEIAKKDLHLFEIAKAYQYTTQYWAGSYFGQADGIFRGESRRNGSMIHYVMNPHDSVVAKAGTPREQRIDIHIVSLPDSAVIRTIKGSMRKGINRVIWDMRRRAVDMPGFARRFLGGAEDEQADRPGIFALPGKYLVRIKHGATTVTQECEIASDPRVKADIEGIKQSYALQMKAGALMEAVTKSVRQITETKRSIRAITADFGRNIPKPKADSLSKSARSLEKRLDSLMYLLVPDETRAGIHDRSAELSSQVGEVMFGLNGSFDAPTQATQVKYDKVKVKVAAVLASINELFAKDIPAFKQQVENAGFSVFGKIESVNLKE